MQRVKKGDTVEVIAGKDLGERGEVLAVLPKEDQVVVQGVNILHRIARHVNRLTGRFPRRLSNLMGQFTFRM